MIFNRSLKGKVGRNPLINVHKYLFHRHPHKNVWENGRVHFYILKKLCGYFVEWVAWRRPDQRFPFSCCHWHTAGCLLIKTKPYENILIVRHYIMEWWMERSGIHIFVLKMMIWRTGYWSHGQIEYITLKGAFSLFEYDKRAKQRPHGINNPHHLHTMFRFISISSARMDMYTSWCCQFFDPVKNNISKHTLKVSVSGCIEDVWILKSLRGASTAVNRTSWLYRSGLMEQIRLKCLCDYMYLSGIGEICGWNTQHSRFFLCGWMIIQPLRDSVTILSPV